MSKVTFTNFASTRTTSVLSSLNTTFSITPGTGANFPTCSGGDWFYCVLTDSLTAPTVREVVKVASRSGDSFSTVVRAQDGTTALNWPSGSYCELRLTKGALEEIQALLATALQAANDLSDLASVITARSNLGLGSMALQNAGAVTISGGAINGCQITGGTLDITPVGSLSPSTGSFTTLAASGAVSGAGFTARFASPGPIGNTAPSTGAFTTLSASGAVSGAGFAAYMASPPAIGGTAPAAITGTVITGKAGAGTGAPVMVGTLALNVTPVGNVGVGEDTLMSYSLPANSLSANGKAVRVKMWGYTSSNSNAKTLSFYFGSALLQTISPVINELNYWTAEIIMTRYDAAVQAKYIHITNINNNVVAFADISIGSATEDETGAILIKATGEGTADDDIVQSGMLVEFIN